MSGWAITEWTVAVAALITAIGVVWRKVVIPVRAFVQRFKAWMERIETATTWTETQMRPNGGESLTDKVNALIVGMEDMRDFARDSADDRKSLHDEIDDLRRRAG